MNSGPPNTARAVYIIGRLYLSRQLNRWQAGRRRANGQRAATPTKAGHRSPLGVGLFLLMVFSGFAVSASGIMRISAVVRNVPESTDKLVVSSFTYARLEEADQALQDLKSDGNRAERGKLTGMWERHLDSLFTSEIRWGSFTDDEEAGRLVRMRQVFKAKGVSGFAPAENNLFKISALTSPVAPQARAVFLGSLGLLFTLWVPMLAFLALGINNKDLSQVEWSLEWLYTFPVSARALFVSRLFVYSVLDQFVWWLLFPFSVLVFIACGHGYASIIYGLAAMLYLAIPAGCVSTVVDVGLRKYLSLGRLKNTQALFSVLGSGCLLIFCTAMFSGPIITTLVHRAGSTPAALAWNPLSLPVTLAANGVGGWRGSLVMLEMGAVDAAAVIFALLASEWLTRDGLVRAGGPYQGTRTPGLGAGGWIGGVGAQELLLLRRDRNLLVQVMVIPLLIPAYYVLIDPHLRSVLTGNFRRAAMVAFVVGAYSFVSSVMPLLSREDQTLWMLYSFPRSLVSILLSKTIFWAGLGLAYGAAVFVLIIRFSTHAGAASWGYAFLAFYGIALYALIAAGIGILGTNVLETERRTQARVSVLYLYFVVAAMYVSIFYAASLWTCMAQLVLSTLLAFALWQKVRDTAPYLLDPTQWPPRAISLADGMVAALAFFVGQPLILMVFGGGRSLALSAQITLAYVIAGLVVALAAIGIFWYQRVPALWRELGLSSRDAHGRHWPATWRAILRGALWGLAAAAAAFVYLHALDLLPQWQMWKQDAEVTSFLKPGAQPLWIWLLLALAAPLVEEFLFRGLIFTGLRRTTGPALAVIGSAALFALVHPPIAVIPVFGLGVAAALAFNRSGLLLAPIAAHAVYNTCILLLGRL